MAWSIKYLQSVQKSVCKCDRNTQKRIQNYLEKRIAGLDDPRQLGKALTGHFSKFWRYRVGDYRIICELRDEEMIVLVVRIKHRKEAYR